MSPLATPALSASLLCLKIIMVFQLCDTSIVLTDLLGIFVVSVTSKRKGL